MLFVPVELACVVHDYSPEAGESGMLPECRPGTEQVALDQARPSQAST
jgi:hypothetical protein